MSLTLSLPPELEAGLMADANREHRPVEEVVLHRLQEAELLRRIFTYFPPAETQEMRSLVRKRQAGTLQKSEIERLTELAHAREERNALRLNDLLTLSRLRGISLRALMTELGIRPIRLE
jgi:hypothetical protein